MLLAFAAQRGEQSLLLASLGAQSLDFALTVGALRRKRPRLDFRALASGVPKATGLDLRVEDLDPVAADGRAVDPSAQEPHPGRYSLAFAASVFAVTDVTRPSGVVRTDGEPMA